jgi:hypothetical protein
MTGQVLPVFKATSPLRDHHRAGKPSDPPHFSRGLPRETCPIRDSEAPVDINEDQLPVYQQLRFSVTVPFSGPVNASLKKRDISTKNCNLCIIKIIFSFNLKTLKIPRFMSSIIGCHYFVFFCF